MNATAKAIPSGKERLVRTTKKAAIPVEALLPEKPLIKTVLVESYGWPTEEMQPSRRQATRR
ncbi:MAG: hypothetical protein ABW190_15500 [Rhizobacter sp.]